MMMMMMMTASRRGDLNLNHTPPPDYQEHVKEGLKQAMIQHDILFKHQVRELHRLYWRQKNLMHEVCWRLSDSICKGPAKEKKVGDLQAHWTTVNSMEMRSTSVEFRVNDDRNFDLQLPAEEFIIRDSADEDTSAYPEVTGSGYDATGHLKFDFSAREANVSSSSGSKALVDNAADTSGSRVTASSDFSSVTGMQNGSEHRLTENCSHTEHHTERWRGRNLICLDGSEEHGGSLSANFLLEKQQPKYKFIHIDLNIAQDDECINVFPTTVEAFPSPSTSSSAILHRDNLRKSSLKYAKVSEPSNGRVKESTFTVRTGVVSPGSENSREKIADSLPHKPNDSHPSSVQVSGQSSNVIDNNWNCKEYIVDNEVCRPGIQSPKEILVERFSSAYNGETQDSTNGVVLADLHKHEKGSIGSSVSEPKFSVHSDSRKKISISSNYMETCCLHASVGSTNLPPKTAGGLDEKEKHKLGSEEDTISSHAIIPDEKQQDELKESSIGIKLNQITGDSECTSKGKSEGEHAVISSPENSGTTQSDLGMPEGICSKEVPNVERSGCFSIQDRPSNSDASQPKEALEQQLSQVVEQDHVIIKAVETLLSICSENPLCSTDQLTSNGQTEFECEEGNDQPQSSDSFEKITLKLEEIRDSGSSICARQFDNEPRKDACGFRLRRGIRDFQKDILPGIVSLSRHEICKDLYAIRYELRKKRSCGSCKENWLAPVRNRRSRIYTVNRRQ